MQLVRCHVLPSCLAYLGALTPPVAQRTSPDLFLKITWHILSMASSLKRGVFCARFRNAFTSRPLNHSRSAARFAFTKSSP